MKSPDLTLLLGPQTRVGRALNDIIRETRGELEANDLVAYPSRIGDKALRDLQGGHNAAEIRASLGIGGPKPVLLSATKGLGAPANSFRSRELLPDAEVYLAHWAELIGDLDAHVILTLDPLPTFFAEMNHTAANSAVAATPWDALYEVSWADLVTSAINILPGAQLTVLTERGAFVAAETVSPLVFGDAAATVSPDRLRATVLPLDNAGAYPSGRAQLSALFARENRAPDDAWLRDVLGMDHVTADLLQDRFAEDLAAISKMAGVQLV